MIAPARSVAFAVIRRVFEHGAYADRALHAEAASLSTRDRQLATALAYGTIQRARTLDHVLAPLVSRPLGRLDPPVLAALRLGAYQLTLMDGIPPHAAVNDSVELVKSGPTRHAAGMVNAVLRRVDRQALTQLRDDTPTEAAILHSVPDWLAELWWAELGAERARALLAAINEPAESALRINALKAETVELPVPAHPAAELPEGRVLDAPFDAYGSPLWRDGVIMPQSRGSMLVSRMLEPRPGERVLDLCAAPGAKTTHLAALMESRGELVAVEVHPGRARALAETCARMGADNVELHVGDAREERPAGDFDRVLVDPPCSGLGTLQSRPDLRWQHQRSQIAELAAKQGQILAAGATAMASGGTLVYSVCTISAAESDGVIDAFLERHREFECDSRRLLTPDRDGTDGFFIARLRRG